MENSHFARKIFGADGPKRDGIVAPRNVRERLSVVMEESKPRPGTSGKRSPSAAETLRALRESASTALADHRRRVEQLEAELSQHIQQLSDEFDAGAVANAPRAAAARDEEVVTLRRQLEEGRAKHEKFVEQLTAARQQLDAIQSQPCLACQDAARELASATNDVRALRAELAVAQRKHDEDQSRHDKFNEQLAAARIAIEELHTQAGDRTAQLQAALDAAEQELESVQELVAAGAAVPELQRELAQAFADVTVQTAQNSALQASLKKADAELSRLRDATISPAELEGLQQMFDLALADVQKLKRENNALREDLSRRPEATDRESPELVAVRSERDALAHRVAELENAASPAVDANSQRDLEDLHRRFEMAVDDVRQLKHENAKLREQNAAKISGTPTAASGPLNWAAQRARLLELLEEEDQNDSREPARRGERATIEGTIAITDQLIAEKDKELADLRAAHIARGHSDVIDRELERILGADDQIAAERERLARLQSEWEEKVRTAELEFSLERAKLARDQAALKERLFDFQQSPQGSALGVGEDNKPRRRWLAALGLGDEAEESRKK